MALKLFEYLEQFKKTFFRYTERQPKWKKEMKAGKLKKKSTCFHKNLQLLNFEENYMWP